MVNEFLIVLMVSVVSSVIVTLFQYRINREVVWWKKMKYKMELEQVKKLRMEQGYANLNEKDIRFLFHVIDLLKIEMEK